VKTEALVETAEMSVVRVNGQVREPQEGHHRRLVVFVGPTTSPGQAVALLRDAADRLAKTLQVVE
jgi:hypothetical protein